MRTKKWVITSVTAVLLLCAACGAKPTDVEYFTYDVNDASEVVITGFRSEECPDDEIVIPAKIEGYPVTEIGTRAF